MDVVWDQLSESGFMRSVSVILVSEIGDKTFLVAAILAMRYARITVFSGALMALAIMSILSAMLGHVVPTLLPKQWTTISAALLFFVFGGRMLQEGLAMEGGTANIEEELKEVTKEIEESSEFTTQPGLDPGRGVVGLGIDGKSPANASLEDMEEGSVQTSSPLRSRSPIGNKFGQSPSPINSTTSQKLHSLGDSIRNLFSLFLSPIFIQAFVLTFLAEWGDRSQITTIALGAAHNVWIVSLGTIIGHSVCTCGAVLGGRWLATKISVKHVTLGGAVLFLIFGCVYAYEAVYENDNHEAS